MANKIELVIQKTLRTFRKFSDKGVLKLQDNVQSDLNELKSLADDITASDINKLRNLLKSDDLKEFLRRKKTSLDYLPVYEDEIISVGVFLLRQGAKLPLHDHPNMYGIIKVLQGILRVRSYSLIDLDKSKVYNEGSMFYCHPLKVIKHPEVRVTDKDQSCLLTPQERNLHEIECIEGPAAFLDILSPPYEDGGSKEPRTCHYFEELPCEEMDEGKVADDYLRLIQVPSPF